MESTRMRVAIVSLVAAAAIVAGGAAFALGSGASADAVIHACRHANGGWLRIPAREGACRARERAVSWNVQGPKGDPGHRGSQGRREIPAPA